MVVKIKDILLTFDIEEFDLPLEFGKIISEDEQLEISKKGTENILRLLEENNITATFFLSTKFARQYPDFVKKISKYHEVGLHCFEHKDNYSDMSEKEAFEKIKNGKEIIEKIINQKIVGFRAPRYQPPAYNVLDNAEIIYDSSLNPTFIPGRYNHFFSRRDISSKNNVKILPMSVSPYLRLPIFWIAFRNLPLIYSKYITRSSKDYACLVFHPWEFVDIKNFDIPFLIKRNTGNKIELKLKDYIQWCLEKKFQFKTIKDYLLIS